GPGTVMKHPLSYIEEKAIAAASDDPQAVRAFTNEIIARTMLAQSAPSIADRLFRNEMAFRARQHPGILEQDIVDSINRNVSLWKLPSFMRTNRAQLQAYRRESRGFVRHYARADEKPTEQADTLSPAEAAFVTTMLVFQKLVNPQYQVDPEQWEKDAAARR